MLEAIVTHLLSDSLRFNCSLCSTTCAHVLCPLRVWAEIQVAASVRTYFNVVICVYLNNVTDRPNDRCDVRWLCETSPQSLRFTIIFAAKLNDIKYSESQRGRERVLYLNKCEYNWRVVVCSAAVRKHSIWQTTTTKTIDGSGVPASERKKNHK